MSDDYFKKCESASQVEIMHVEEHMFRAADTKLSLFSHVFNILDQRQRLSQEYVHNRHKMSEQHKVNIENIFKSYNDDLKNLLGIM